MRDGPDGMEFDIVGDAMRRDAMRCIAIGLVRMGWRW